MEARGVLEDAENDLRNWERTFEPVPMSSADTNVAGISRSTRNPRDAEEQETDGTASDKEGEEEGGQQQSAGQTSGGRRNKKKAKAVGSPAIPA